LKLQNSYDKTFYQFDTTALGNKNIHYRLMPNIFMMDVLTLKNKSPEYNIEAISTVVIQKNAQIILPVLKKNSVRLKWVITHI